MVNRSNANLLPLVSLSCCALSVDSFEMFQLFALGLRATRINLGKLAGQVSFGHFQTPSPEPNRLNFVILDSKLNLDNTTKFTRGSDLQNIHAGPISIPVLRRKIDKSSKNDQNSEKKQSGKNSRGSN